jgi:type II secretory pathway pseudopilin PulG
MLSKKIDSGRSIVEMLGVLAIMGVITVMGISGYSQAVARLNRNKVQEDITRISQEIRTLYAGRNYPTDGGASGTGSTTSGIKGSVMGVMGVTNLPSAYGSEYIIYGLSTGGGFGICVPNVPQPDCISFITQVWQQARTNAAASQTSGSEKPYILSSGGTCPAPTAAGGGGSGTLSTGLASECGTLNTMTLYFN